VIRLGLVLSAAAALVVAGCSSGAGTSYVQEDCVRRGAEGRSVPRIWNEVLLDAIRRVSSDENLYELKLFISFS
jgi:hypothetical protein